jgi:hypothetical protein
LTLCHLLLQLSWLSPVWACNSVVLWFQVQHNCSVGLWAGFLESFQFMPVKRSNLSLPH